MAKEVQKPATNAPAMPKYRERLGKRYKDANPQSDQEWDELAERAYAEDEADLTRFRDNEKVIQDLLDGDKDLAAVVGEMLVNGTPFRVAVGKFFGPDELTPKEGDEDYEYYQKSSEERRAMGKAFRERSAQKKANASGTYDNIDKFAEKKGMSEEEKQRFIDFVNTLYDDLSMLKISNETLTKLYKAMTYDEAVAEAAENAEMDGRNAAIEAKRVKKQEATAGDGVPTPNGGSAPATTKPRRRATIFDDIPKKKFQ